MGRSNWTPSIVPNENDRTVYLVAEDFGKSGRAWTEADYETTDQRPLFKACLPANTATPSVSSLSTPPKAGPKTCRKTSHTNFDDAAIFRCAISRSSSISPTVMRADTTTFSCHCPCAWGDR